MNLSQKIYCRVFQGPFRTALPVLPYREPEIFDSSANYTAPIKAIPVYRADRLSVESRSARYSLNAAVYMKPCESDC